MNQHTNENSQIKIKHIKSVMNNGGRAGFGRPPTLLGYIRDVVDFYFDYFRLYVDSFDFMFWLFFHFIFDYLISFDLAFDLFVDLLRNNQYKQYDRVLA